MSKSEKQLAMEAQNGDRFWCKGLKKVSVEKGAENSSQSRRFRGFPQKSY